MPRSIRKPKNIAAALIGCGRIGWLLERDDLRYKPCTHLGALAYWRKKYPSLTITGLCDADVRRAEAAAETFGISSALIAEEYKAIIAEKPDLLVIAASTSAHFEILATALSADIPLIVVEKPVAFSAHEARALRRKIARSRSVVLPNYERRYHPKYRTLKAKVAQARSYRGFFAASGRSLHANARKGDEGVLLHDTTHLLDLAQFFFGAVRRSERINVKGRHVLYLEHDQGVCGTIETVMNLGAFHFELEIHTPRERIVVGNGFLDTEVIRASPHYRNLKSYAAPKRALDKILLLSQNPFVKLYETALFGNPDNAHFLEALKNIELLSLGAARFE